MKIDRVGYGIFTLPLIESYVKIYTYVRTWLSMFQEVCCIPTLLPSHDSTS